MATVKDFKEKQVYIDKAREKEKEYNLPPNLLVGLLAQESGHFNKDVISGKKKSYAGAIGIGQFMKATAKAYKIDPLNVDQAIDASAKYLASSYKSLGNWDDAILSYNAGLGRVKEYRSGKPIKIKEHAEYVDRVKNQINRYGGTTTTSEKQPITADVEVFDLPKQNSTFVAVPDVYKEPEKDKDIEEVKAKTQEVNFMEAYQELLNKPQEQTVVQQEQQIPQQQVDLNDIYNQVDAFISAQQGGKFSENELSFLSAIAIKDIPISSQGVYKYPKQEVVVPTVDGRITMKNIPYLIEGTDEYGNTQMMYPNKEYKFKGKIIYEKPQI